MHKSYISLSVLLFTSLTSLYIPTILGMECKYQKQIQYLYNNTKKNNDLEPIFFNNLTKIQLPKEIINNIIYALKILPSKDVNNLRLVNKYHAQQFAQNPSTWSFMPDNVKKAYNLLPARAFDKNIGLSRYKSDLILSIVAEQNDLKAVKWIINNIDPVSVGYLCDPDINSIVFAKKNKNIEMGEALIKIKLKRNGFSKDILDAWKTYYDLPCYDLPSADRQNYFFPSYILAVYLDNKNRLQELYSQTEPSLYSTHSLLLKSSHSPNCYIYLFEQYKDYFMMGFDDHLQTASNDVIKNYLKKQQSYSCTIQ